MDYIYNRTNWPQNLQPGDTVGIPWDGNDYYIKIHAYVSFVTYYGIKGPHGELPALNGNGAREQQTPGYYGSVENSGLITVAPTYTHEGEDTRVDGVVIRDLELKNCNGMVSGWYPFGGDGVTLVDWNEGAAGVSMWLAKNVLIKDCYIRDNANGVFGGGDYGIYHVLENIHRSGVKYFNQGLPDDDHKHHDYVEAIGDIVEFCTFLELRENSGGTCQKSRSGGYRCRYNLFTSGSRALDMVNPDATKEIIGENSSYNDDQVYGNIFLTPDYSTAPIHLGYDTDSTWARTAAKIHFNTFVNRTSNPTDTAPVRLEAPAYVTLANNIIWAVSEIEGESFPGKVYPGFNPTGYSPTTVEFFKNGWPWFGEMGGISGVVDTVIGYDRLLVLETPDFVDPLSDWTLLSGSACRNQAEPLQPGWEVPNYQLNPSTGTWVPRTDWNNLGAIE